MDEDFKLEKLRIHDRLTNVEKSITSVGNNVKNLTEAIVGKVNNGQPGLKMRIDRVENKVNMGVKIICFVLGGSGLLGAILFLIRG